jgi:hypothetical protein
VITIAGTTYFTLGTGFVVLLLAAPLLWGFSVWALRPNIEGKPFGKRLAAVGGLTTVLLLGLAVGLFWDVYLIGQRAKVLCEKSGLAVTHTVEATCIAGLADIEYWSKRGFDCLEVIQGEQKYRLSVRDGKVQRLSINDLSSRYQFSSSQHFANRNDGFIERHFVRLADVVTEIPNNETIGILTAYSVEPGWIDALVIQTTGFSFTPWICQKQVGGEISIAKSRPLMGSDLIRATIRPAIDPRTGSHERNQLN